jgi:acyl carrier protein
MSRVDQSDKGEGGMTGAKTKKKRKQARIRAATLQILADIAPEVDLEQIDPDVAFADQFDFDSVNCLNLVLALGRELGVEIPETDCHRLSTLNGCVTYLTARIPA